ncbi:DUF488 family protein [Streptomyces sp. NPDC020681]|uniref:DUF488 family protein n=1 Tax=Streptomyces sp. NPDC020681 TaxID=3365083 RepID=UPI00379965EA
MSRRRPSAPSATQRVAELPSDSVTALLCVERDPEACHRSLVAARLRAEYCPTPRTGPAMTLPLGTDPSPSACDLAFQLAS